jgi:Glycosyltransferase family 28 N-terminal domain
MHDGFLFPFSFQLVHLKIGIFNWGTRGDVQPFIALALGLANQGHQVTLFAPENFRISWKNMAYPMRPCTGMLIKSFIPLGPFAY